MVEAVSERLWAAAKKVDTEGTPTREVDPVEPEAGVEKLGDMGDEDPVEPGAHVEKLEDMGDEDPVEPGAGVEKLEDTRDVVRTTEEKLADILAAGRTPHPDREFKEYLLWLTQHVNTTAAPPAPKRGFLRRLLG